MGKGKEKERKMMINEKDEIFSRQYRINQIREVEGQFSKIFILKKKQNRFLFLTNNRPRRPSKFWSPKEFRDWDKYSTMLSNLEHWVNWNARKVSFLSVSGVFDGLEVLSGDDLKKTQYYILSDSFSLDGTILNINEITFSFKKNLNDSVSLFLPLNKLGKSGFLFNSEIFDASFILKEK